MNRDRIVIVLDCGATNVRAVAVNEFGQVVAIKSLPNNTQPDPLHPKGLIWDVEEIWSKFAQCTKGIMANLNPSSIAAVTVTTFGVNGAPVDRSGKLLHPVISWQCQRTVPIMKGMGRYIDPKRLYEISGVNQFHFNTINSLVWLKENQPEAIDGMEAFLFMPSLFIHKLTGRMVNDYTMAGTSMLTDHRNRNFSDEILSSIGVPSRFGTLAAPGTVAGYVTKVAANKLSIPGGIPVVLAGHDTQFALIGAGAKENDVVLSSGTWEILMARIRNVKLSAEAMSNGVTNELDAMPNLYNSGIQWLASGTLEWMKRMLFSDLQNEKSDFIYNKMIEEASAAGSSSVKVETDLDSCSGAIAGIGMKTSRGEIYRAALETLSSKARQSLTTLERIGEFKANSLIVGGGSTRNRLWNQLRANALGIPLKLHKEKETTVIGAAIFAFTGIGVYNSVENAMDSIKPEYDMVYPE